MEEQIKQLEEEIKSIQAQAGIEIGERMGKVELLNEQAKEKLSEKAPVVKQK